MKLYKAARVIFFSMASLLPVSGSADVAGGFLVYARDTSAPTVSPPSTTAYLDGEEQSYGDDCLTTFSGYFEEGIHTVEVVTATSGYLYRQSPDDPDAVDDPYSPYGNPRYISISTNESYVPVGFQFDPVLTVTAEVRDGWTMEKLEDVAIEFIFEGSTGDIVKTRYPSHASYAEDWFTGSGGAFPTNVILYLHDYDLRLRKDGYEINTWEDIIIFPSAGDAYDLGTLFLYPLDADTNALADSWELEYFNGGCNPGDDADSDGMCNYDEYIAGTDPTNWYSCLWLQQTQLTNGFELVWETEPDRTYYVSGTTNLTSSTNWIQVGGPWETTNGQLEMVWVETNQHLSWNTAYRIDVAPCWWSGTNSILVHTNTRPAQHYTGGTSGTNNIPPIPPLP